VSFAAITLCVASERVFLLLLVVVVYFVIDSVRKLLDTPSYFHYLFKQHYFFKGLSGFRVKNVGK
jgi:hypothetical protein